MPPANGEPDAGIADPDSIAGSSTAADNGNRNLYVSKSAREVVEFSNAGRTLWNKRGESGYLEESPRKRYFRKDSPGRTCQRSPRAFNETENRPAPTSLPAKEGTRQKKKADFKTAKAGTPSGKNVKKKHEEKKTEKETVLEMNIGRIRGTQTG